MGQGPAETPNTRDLEEGIQKDFSSSMSYGDYLRLDVLLSAQRPLSEPQQSSTRPASSGSS
jgi:tryptophan 2,3-dioxygenase